MRPIHFNFPTGRIPNSDRISCKGSATVNTPPPGPGTHPPTGRGVFYLPSHPTAFIHRSLGRFWIVSPSRRCDTSVHAGCTTVPRARFRQSRMLPHTLPRPPPPPHTYEMLAGGPPPWIPPPFALPQRSGVPNEPPPPPGPSPSSLLFPLRRTPSPPGNRPRGAERFPRPDQTAPPAGGLQFPSEPTIPPLCGRSSAIPSGYVCMCSHHSIWAPFPGKRRQGK